MTTKDAELGLELRCRMQVKVDVNRSRTLGGAAKLRINHE
jgi:hypothetical protein